MAYAQELKNLVAEIKAGHRDRAARIDEIRGETRDILKGADDYIKKVAGELKDMARDLKDFLAKSEGTRKKDFNAMMGEIQAKIKEIKGYMKDLLLRSEEKRIADFKALMKDIAGDIAGIKKRVEGLKEDTRGMLSGYKAERKEAAGYWARLKAGEKAEETESTEEEAPRAGRKRGRPRARR